MNEAQDETGRVAIPGTGGDPPKRNMVKMRPPEDRRILLDGQKAARDMADSLGYEYDDSIGNAAAVSVFNAMRAERDAARSGLAEGWNTRWRRICYAVRDLPVVPYYRRVYCRTLGHRVKMDSYGECVNCGKKIRSAA